MCGQALHSLKLGELHESKERLHYNSMGEWLSPPHARATETMEKKGNKRKIDEKSFKVYLSKKGRVFDYQTPFLTPSRHLEMLEH